MQWITDAGTMICLSLMRVKWDICELELLFYDESELCKHYRKKRNNWYMPNHSKLQDDPFISFILFARLLHFSFIIKYKTDC